MIKKGNVYGRLTVVNKSEKLPGTNKVYWKCKCTCGAFKLVQTRLLTNGKTKSCGCMRKEKTSKRTKTHGLSNHPLYGVWCAARRKYMNSEADNYIRYGGAGYEFSGKWINDFPAFKKDMENLGWKDGMIVYLKKPTNFNKNTVQIGTRSDYNRTIVGNKSKRKKHA